MEKRGVSLTRIQEMPKESLIMLVGPPGAGKSTFCQQVVLKSIAAERPIIYITTEQSPTGVTGLLKEKGMGEQITLNFVDAFTETVGLTCAPRSDTLCANCADLNSLSMATTKLQERVGQKGVLLAFDSLTSPYLFCGTEITKFIRMFLARFAAEGNAVLALVDEGCGKEEDLGAMMSMADGILRMEIKESSRAINVVKHPNVAPERIEIPSGRTERDRIGIKYMFDNNLWDDNIIKQFIRAWIRGDKATLRKEPGDYVNLFWPNLAQWSGMLWDPKRFPKLKYDLNKEDASQIMEMFKFFPWQWRLLLKFLPKSYNKVSDMKKFMKPTLPYFEQERSGIVEYLEDVSRTLIVVHLRM
jgi:KaiC/GvpD/RAD55 family RecA-like ATPase